MLDEFPNHRTVGQDVNDAQIGDPDDSDADLIGECGDPVDKGVGKAQAGGLERRGSRAD